MYAAVRSRDGGDVFALVLLTEQIMLMLQQAGICTHGFGVKKAGVARYSRLLTSADSMAWSYNARYTPPLPGCTHKRCSNCLRYALRWRSELLAREDWLELDLGLAA